MPIRLSLRAITPKRLPTIDMKRVERELRDVIGKFAKQDIREAFESTVATWKTPVTFRVGTFIGGDEISANVFPSGDPGAQIWAWLNDGTRRHFVRPKKKPFLSWRSGYTAKTSPGLVGSGPGGPSGPYVFSRKGHWVSGIQARKWTQKIAQNVRRDYRRQIENALRRAVK